MSAGLERVRQTMADYLNSRGVTAVTAWSAEPRKERTGAVVVVSLQGCRVEPAGFRDYLGERYDQEQDRWEERYGRKARITFGLDIYGAEKGGGQEIQQAFDTLAEALLLGAPEGLAVEEFSCGQTGYDPDSRGLRRPVQAVCAAYLYAVAQDSIIFTDFDLRGVLKQ